MKIEKDTGKIKIITYMILLIPGTTLLAIKNGDGFSQHFNNKSDIIIKVHHVPPCVLSILCGLLHSILTTPLQDVQLLSLLALSSREETEGQKAPCLPRRSPRWSWHL